MKEQKITKETIELAKNKYPFDYSVSAPEFKEPLGVPTQFEFQKWLREKHGVAVDVISYIQQDEDKNQEFSFIYSILKLHATDGRTSKHYNTYEEALEQGLQKGLELI